MGADGLQNTPPVGANVPVLAPGHTYATITDKISEIVLTQKTKHGWWLGLAIGLTLLMVLQLAIGLLLTIGTGIWGINIPVGWGFAIVNFVWWIGIGHAGTLISAFLLLMRQAWRQSINRFAEAMTLFAVACAGMFPLLHMGRPWLGFWLIPYPDTMGTWPQFRSPLVWDVFAVSTYGTISLLFWFVGLIPDLATLRDRARGRSRASSMALWPWAGADRHATGIAMKWPTFCLRDWRRHWWFPYIRWLALISPWRSFPVGTARYFRLTLWPAPSIRDLPW